MSNTPPPSPSDTEPPGARKKGYGKDPLHSYGLMTPLFWHGMLPGDFWRMMKKNGCRVSLRGASYAAAITAVGMGHLVGAASQKLLHGKQIASAQPEKPPLFVLGHWRSGTTLLHEFLIRDSRHTYPTTYECFAPHHFLTTESWFTPMIGWLLPKKRPMDNVATGWNRPQEDEFALCSMGLPSPYRSWAFPKHGPVDADWLTLENVSESDRQRWREALRRFVHTLTVRRPGRVVLKSPPHTARVKTLLEIFPDAKFVHISRDPLVLFPSTVRLWRSLSMVQSLQGPKENYDWIEEEVFSNLERMYEAFERDRELIPEGNLAELSYEDLIADPKAQLRGIYDQLDLGDFTAVETALDAYLQETGDYKTNRYELPDDIREKVSKRWAAYAERYGYAG